MSDSVSSSRQPLRTLASQQSVRIKPTTQLNAGVTQWRTTGAMSRCCNANSEATFTMKANSGEWSLSLVLAWVRSEIKQCRPRRLGRKRYLLRSLIGVPAFRLLGQGLHRIELSLLESTASRHLRQYRRYRQSQQYTSDADFICKLVATPQGVIRS